MFRPLSRIAGSFLLVALVPAAHAQSTTLSISGNVLPGTCTLTAPAIALDAVKADEMTAATPAKVKAGALNFTGCVGVKRARLSFDGIAASGDPERWENTAKTTPATGVSIALLSGSTGSNYLKKGSTATVTVGGATATYPLRAGYYIPTTGGINAGNVTTEIVITAAYD